MVYALNPKAVQDVRRCQTGQGEVIGIEVISSPSDYASGSCKYSMKTLVFEYLLAALLV